METEGRVQFYLKIQRYTATITTVSSIPSTCRKPPEILKPDMGSSAPEKKLGALQKIQNREFYLIESAPIEHQTLTKRLNVEKIIKYDRATMVHKILKEMCPEILIGKFIRRTQISKYESRRTNDLQIPKLRLEFSKNSFSYVGAKIWNDIPNDIRNMESTHLFKHKMKTYLLDQ